MIFLFTAVTKEDSCLCAVKVEITNQQCQDSKAPDQHLAPLPSTDDKSTLETVTVKQEKPVEEEERDGSVCCLDSIKVEDFSLDCMSAVQSKMLEGWEPEVSNAQSQDPNTPLSCTSLAQGKEQHSVCLKQSRNVRL